MIGTEKVALFLLSIGPEAAAKVMRHFDEATTRAVSAAMARMRQVDSVQADAVVSEFLQHVKSKTTHSVDGFHFVRQTLDEALGENQAARIMELIMRGGSMASTMEIMRDADPLVLAEQMRGERPQAIALLLAHLEPAAGSELLLHLPDDVARDVLYRYARLESLQPHILKELGGMLTEQLSGQLGSQQLSGIGGPRKAADILNNLQVSATDALLTRLGEKDAALADLIRENMFTFSDLVQLDSRSLQALLREIPNEQMVPALKAAPPELVDKILANVSTRAAESLREDLDSGPPVRRADAEGAQKAILRKARELDAAGTISISSAEDML